MNLIYLVFFFLLGLVMGSFFCVVGLRLARKENFVTGRSYCDSCYHELYPKDLIPLIKSFMEFDANTHENVPPIVMIIDGISKKSCNFENINVPWSYVTPNTIRIPHMIKPIILAISNTATSHFIPDSYR